MSLVEPELTQEQWLRSIWTALTRMEELLSQPRLEAIPVEYPPPPEVDYDRLTASIVGMLSQLHPQGPTATEIADAIRLIWPADPTEELPQQGARALEEVAQALRNLDHRLKGMGTQAYGGGAVHIDEASLARISGPVSHTTNVYAVAASTSVQTIGDADAGRVAMTILNEPGSARMFLKFGPGASAASYSNVLGPGDYWESVPPKFTGPVTAVWEAATGRAMVTEFLP